MESYPRSVLELALGSSGLRHLQNRFRPDTLVLKVVGREEYLLEDTSIIRYKVSVLAHHKVSTLHVYIQWV